MSAEFIVFDDSRKDDEREVIGIAMDEARSAGLNPTFYRDAEKAAEALGFFTQGIVTSSGKDSFLQSRYTGITLLDAAQLIEVPRAIFLDEGVVDRFGNYIREDGVDIFVPRQPYSQAQKVLKTWITSLAKAA